MFKNLNLIITITIANLLTIGIALLVLAIVNLIAGVV